MSAEKLNPVNPGPLGLLGFGMTTILLNLHNAEIIPLSIVIVAMGLALGGAAQIIAGILEFCHGNTFGGTAFVAYGFFWWSLVLIWVCPFDSIAAGDSTSLGFYLLLWGIFSLFMFIGTLKHNRITQVVFGSFSCSPSVISPVSTPFTWPPAAWASSAAPALSTTLWPRS